MERGYLNEKLCRTLIIFLTAVRMENSAMDMQAQPGRDHLWKTSLRRGSMVSMEKSLVYLESLMVFLSLPRNNNLYTRSHMSL